MLVCGFCDAVFRDGATASASEKRDDHYMDEHQDALRALLAPESREVSPDA